ncbi:MAG: TM0106 family RecB-like putative nuclease [Candidatus Velthaea sp.]
MLYDLEQCRNRPWMDLYADPARRDAVSPFVELLWRRGRTHEEEVIAAEGTEGILNLRVAPLEQRESLTVEAMDRREPLIYGGRISVDDLLGEPDLLRLEGNGYVPGDIKSGAGEEDAPSGDRKPKVDYGVQLALYVDVLERTGRSPGRRAFVWDINGEEVRYDLSVPRGPRSPSLWETYTDDLAQARAIIAKTLHPGSAYGGICKNCWWLTACIESLEASDDLTLLPDVGRSRREPLLAHVASIAQFAATPVERFLDGKGKSVLKGLGPDSIRRFHARAVLCASGGKQYLKSDPGLPNHPVELFFDIETDPLRDHCYLHGFIERSRGDNTTETFHAFFSDDPNRDGERSAFAAAWAYVQSRRPCAIYFYSKYERTWWRALQERFPDVCSAAEIEELFADPGSVDLLAIVSKHTEWPTRDHTLKTLAKYLGFQWRDAHPSGAASIEWYERFLEGDPDAKERILAYNEDDCRATRVLLDEIRALQPADVTGI